MSQRSANYSIKGYLYQFNKTIEQILYSSGDTEITIEGIEDIDLTNKCTTNLIQCKYHEAKRFTPSAVSKAIGLMLKHSIETTSTIPIYTLFAHFKENAPQNVHWATSDYLRNSLKKICQKFNPSDTQIETFKKQFRFIPGFSFDELCRSVKDKLSKDLSCTQDDVDHYFYNNAIAYIAELSALTELKKRRIKKNKFLEKVNKKHFLFDRWLLELKGRKAYISHAKEILKKSGALNNTKRRFLLVSQELLNTPTAEVKIITLFQNLLDQYGISGRLYNSTLWTVIIDANPTQLKEIKTSLIQNDIYYNDGYEEQFFSANYFNVMPIKNTNHNDKIERSSHDIRLISASTFHENYKLIVQDNNYPHVFINTMDNHDLNSLFLNNSSTAIYQISALKNLFEVNQILNLRK